MPAPARIFKESITTSTSPSVSGVGSGVAEVSGVAVGSGVASEFATTLVVSFFEPKSDLKSNFPPIESYTIQNRPANNINVRSTINNFTKKLPPLDSSSSISSTASSLSSNNSFLIT